MIVPFLLTYASQDKKILLSYFFQFVNMARKYNWPVIAQEHYFEEIEKHKVDHPHIFDPSTTEMYEYPIPEGNYVRDIQPYVISKERYKSVIEEYGGLSGAHGALLNGGVRVFIDIVNEILDAIERNNTVPIKAILCMSDYPDLREICNKRKIRLIFHEYSCFRRTSGYYNGAFFSFDGMYANDSAKEKLYKEFERQIKNSERRLLSRKEILALFLFDDKLYLLDRYDSIPQYEIGVATGWPFVVGTLMQNYANDEQLLYDVSYSYPLEQVLIRNHPTDVSRIAYPRFSKNLDNSPNSVDFILKCKRVVSLGSNVSLEAAFWDRTPYTIINCPQHYMTLHDISDKRDYHVPLSYLNWLAFCYIIPWNFLSDAEYIMWRCTNPSELELFNKHIDYYLHRFNIERDVLDLEPIQSIAQIIKIRRKKR